MLDFLPSISSRFICVLAKRISSRTSFLILSMPTIESSCDSISSTESRSCSVYGISSAVIIFSLSGVLSSRLIPVSLEACSFIAPSKRLRTVLPFANFLSLLLYISFSTSCALASASPDSTNPDFLTMIEKILYSSSGL